MACIASLALRASTDDPAPHSVAESNAPCCVQRAYGASNEISPSLGPSVNTGGESKYQPSPADSAALAIRDLLVIGMAYSRRFFFTFFA